MSTNDNDLYNELYPLETCVPTDNKHMGKQISALAAKMREKRRACGLKMNSSADWIRVAPAKSLKKPSVTTG